MSALTDVPRIFTDEKIVENHALNRAGVQPMRAVLARVMYAMRRRSPDPLIAELSRTGIVVCEDFLPVAEFTALAREAEAFMQEPPSEEFTNGSSRYRHYSLVSADPARYPHLRQWRANTRVGELATAAERRKRVGDGAALLQWLDLGDLTERDEQCDLHADAFFNTHKMWLYLDDVDLDNGAFVYVPGSHRLDRVRLRHDYLESVGGNRGSRRVGDDEVQSRGLERRVICCPRNTLVLANTCGYHARSVGVAGAMRRSIHMSFRGNPFSVQALNPARAARYLARRVRAS